MGVIKYPFYIACALFAVLTVYSVTTEKPRQYKAKPVEELTPSNASKPLAELWNSDEAITAALTPRSAHPASPADSTNPTNNSKASNPVTQKVSEPVNPTSTPQGPVPASSSNNVVVGYSNNDAGGKIVLTLNKCEKGVGTVAYTTAPDGRVDYGCWTFDELYIVINWDKAGVNNYTYDRFLEVNTSERLTPRLLFAAHLNQNGSTQSSAAPPSPSAAVAGAVTTTKTLGGNK